MFEKGQEPIRGYRLTTRLGRGGCGEVWEAVRGDGATVAVKFLDCRNQPSSLVANEIRILVKLRELQHPAIIRLHDVCAINQHIALIMDRAEGSLHELQQVYLQETGRQIPSEHLLDLLDQAAAGLDFLAEQPRPRLCQGGYGMQHCDVKPSNLLILQDGLKLADFGLCMSSLAGTHTGRFMGTPPYAAPELYDGRISPQTDQYGLAVTFVDLVSGGRAMLPMELACRPRACPVDLRKLRTSELPVLSRALDPNWMNRWPNCKAFLTALRKALARPRDSGSKLGSHQLQNLRRHW